MATMSDLAGTETALLGARTLERRWGWLLLLGIVQIIGGVIALIIPTAASLAAALVAGAVLLAAGVFHLVHAFSIRPWRGAVLPIVEGLLFVVAGGLLLAFPLSGALTLTIIVAVLLIADGVLRLLFANSLRPLAGSGWLMAAGIASVIVGILMLVGWPLTGLWALGILLGINLLFTGTTNTALAIAFRGRRRREGEAGAFEQARRHA
ncbi:MAG TPA: DUF308 domain-containing protein [Steroidobacteraceae bacterium]|jgi:uncharacterized membrane protein HdeD (DUF308 family)|nr:DUF308 domain-containing protein [Steroidobacteraceae bacterium]